MPFAALAYVFGRAAMCWDRAWRSWGRPKLVGTTVKHEAQMPQAVGADEKITWRAGAEVVIPTTVGEGWVLGMSVAPEAPRDGWPRAYGECVAEAQAVFPDYQARSACPDGFHATRAAWRQLFPPLPLGLCFLPSRLKITERGRGALRRRGLERAWHVDQAVTQGQFSPRRRRLSEGARATLDRPVAEMVRKGGQPRADCTPAYACPPAARTTNAVERRHNPLARVL